MQTPAEIPQDLDDTARLILMDQPEEGSSGMRAVDLRRALYREGYRPTVEQVQALARRYIGAGGAFATHDVVTGKQHSW